MLLALVAPSWKTRCQAPDAVLAPDDQGISGLELFRRQVEPWALRLGSVQSGGIVDRVKDRSYLPDDVIQNRFVFDAGFQENRDVCYRACVFHQ